jgi:hypothetical protein
LFLIFGIGDARIDPYGVGEVQDLRVDAPVEPVRVAVRAASKV